MIPEKVKEISDKANSIFLEEGKIYTSEEVKYGYAEKVIELTLREVERAVDEADLKNKTYTTYDRDMLMYCKEQIKSKISEIFLDVEKNEPS